MIKQSSVGHTVSTMNAKGSSVSRAALTDDSDSCIIVRIHLDIHVHHVHGSNVSRDLYFKSSVTFVHLTVGSSQSCYIFYITGLA